MYAPARLPIHLIPSMVLSLLNCKIKGCSKKKIGHRFPCILKKKGCSSSLGGGYRAQCTTGATQKGILCIINKLMLNQSRPGRPLTEQRTQTASKLSKPFLFLHTALLCTFIQKPTLQGVTVQTL